MKLMRHLPISKSMSYLGFYSILRGHSRRRLTKHLLDANREDIFNCDKTGINFKEHLKRILTSTSLKGTKRDMDRLTLLLCCNVIGTKRLKSLMCGKCSASELGGVQDHHKHGIQIRTSNGRRPPRGG